MEMDREEFELFVQEIDQHVYDLTNHIEKNSNFNSIEMGKISLDLLLLKNVKKTFKTYVTGLHEIGINKKCDPVEIHIIFGNNYYEKEDFEKDIGIMGVLRDILDHNEDWKVLKTFYNEASIECLYRLTKQKFIISIGNGLKVEQNKILKHLFNIQPEAATFYHFIVHWVLEKSSCGLDRKYLLLLVVFFLQKLKFMPPLFDVFLNVPKIYIDGFETQFDASRNIRSYNLKPMDYYRKYVHDFFHFYRCFDFQYYIISIHRGFKVAISKYWREYNNPSAMNIIFVKLENNYASSAGICNVNDFVEICHVSYRLFKDF